MVKIMDIEISTSKLVLRILTAFILFSLSLAALYFVPRLLIEFASSTIQYPQLKGFVNQLLNPFIPTIGIIISAIVFSTMTLRKTKLEGPLLFSMGLMLILYIYMLLQGGSINLQIPTTEIQNNLGVNLPISIQANLTISTTTLMLTAMITPLLLILKGVILTVSRAHIKIQ